MSLTHKNGPPPEAVLSDLDDESDDDDFAPEQTSDLPARSKTRDDTSDGEDSETEETNGTRAGDSIDADEVAAMKREREQMIEEAGGEHRLGKRRRAAATDNDDVSLQIPNQDADSAAKEAEEAWQAMKSTETLSAEPKTALSTEDMISIPHTYKFAGEQHTSTKQLPRFHPEAIAYLASLTAVSAEPKAAKPVPRPGPRKKKSSLASLAAAASSTQPAKLNTLEKSKLDWDNYKQTPNGGLTQQERDEIEQQTKGGASGLGNMKGYLERQDFLDRVKGRTGQLDK